MGTQAASMVAVPPSADRPTQPARTPSGRHPSAYITGQIGQIGHGWPNDPFGPN